MLTSVDITNFTVFRKAHFEFGPGINVFVGANASGKTHLAKLIYALHKAQYDAKAQTSHPDAYGRLLGVFRPESLNDLIRQESNSADVSVSWEEVEYKIRITADRGNFSSQLFTNFETGTFENNGNSWNDVTTPILIPVKDMLAHSVGFLSLYDRREIDFDETYRDVLFLAFTPVFRKRVPNDYSEVMEVLSAQLEGSVEMKNERFYLAGNNGRYEMHLVAEGWRKIALLYQLIANGSIFPGTVLYWDEPETNLNPLLMAELVKVLHMIARRGTQIFLATHSYIILKELELQSKADDSLRLFAMKRNAKDGSVTPHQASTYLELEPNLIAKEFDRIYDLEIERAFGRA